MRASNVAGIRAKKSKTYPEGRVCEVEDCVTVLSIYNKHDQFCFAHSPKKFPRVRGREATDDSSPKCAKCAARAGKWKAIPVFEEDIGGLVHRMMADGGGLLCEHRV